MTMRSSQGLSAPIAETVKIATFKPEAVHRVIGIDVGIGFELKEIIIRSTEKTYCLIAVGNTDLRIIEAVAHIVVEFGIG